MYEAYYGFEEKPFALSPDPKYLFLSATHREVLGHLLYGIEEGEGFMAISGEVGTGKTTLCRTLLDRLGSNCEIAFLFNPTLTPLELVSSINGELGLSTFGDSRPELLDVLNTFLLEQNARGRRVLVIIDEAQNLPIETLEQLRLLSNLESQTSKLLQIVLIGQPELDEILETKELRQLRQRISVWWRLGPLEPTETRDYVRHRLRLASTVERPIFSEAALVAVHRATGGVPRLVNVLCDRALLAGFGDQTLPITPRMVRDVAREIRLVRSSWRARALRLGLLGTGLAALAGLAFVALPREVSEPAAPASPRESAPPPVAAPAPDTSFPREPAPLPGSPLAPAAPAAARSESAPRALPGSAPDSLPQAPPQTAPTLRGDGPLEDLLGVQTPGESNARALSVLLDAWRLPADGPADPSFPQLLTALEERGLRVLQFRSADELERLDVPGLIQLRGPDGELHGAVVRHVEGGNAQLEGVVPGQLVQVPVEELARSWSGPGYAAWRDFEGLPPVLRSGRSGPSVAFLQRSLERLGLYGGEIHGSYDDATRDAVMQFQRGAGLTVDGDAGPITQVRLYHALPDYRMPALAFRREAQARN